MSKARPHRAVTLGLIILDSRCLSVEVGRTTPVINPYLFQLPTGDFLGYDKSPHLNYSVKSEPRLTFVYHSTYAYAS